MNRRNFFKFFGKGAAAAVAVTVVGLPKVDDKSELIQTEEAIIPDRSSRNHYASIENDETLYISGEFTDAGPHFSSIWTDWTDYKKAIDLTEGKEITYGFLIEEN